MEKGTKIETEKEKIIIERIRIGKERWRIVEIYASREEIERILENVWNRKRKA